MGLIEKVARELHTLRIFVATARKVGKVSVGGSDTVADTFEAVVDRAPDAPALRFGERRYTYRQLDEAANRVAGWARGQSIGAGDIVALLMLNRPEYLFIWLGLAKVGAQIALINTNTRAAPLAHAIDVSGASHVVVGAELADALAGAMDSLSGAPRVWVSAAGLAGGSSAAGKSAGWEDVDVHIEKASSARPPASLRTGIKTGDNLFFIYTSGTTGLPKAAFFSHYRFIEVAGAYTGLAGITASDRIYCCLPLYHTAGGVVAVSMALLNGATLVLRDKFSASQFWDDCREHGVTVFQYIGELCRYLLGVPARSDDRMHSVRCAVGNGLRPDIWAEFQERFGIRDIREFYGATEGNFALVNIDNKVGAVGRVPPYARKFFGVKLVRFDVETESHPRGADGFMIECEPGEAGEAIGLIPDKEGQPMGRFEGYRNQEASAKKVLRDVFSKGDSWYRTGDLLRRDGEGYYYFVDRIGDTFRWKGENVATSEVAEVLSVSGGVKEVNVYGVSVPGQDGRAGMAAIVPDESMDLASLYGHVTSQLAVYARPLFVRIRPEIETTGTFKHRKVDLVEDGFDPGRVADPIYFRDDSTGAFIPVDAAMHERIVKGQVRV